VEQSAHGPLPIRHALVHERGLFQFSLIAGVLIFLALTGLAIWLLPFSVPTQVSVLAHTAAGLVVVLPVTIWQLSHWLATRRARRSFRKICAYAGFWTMAVLSVSGLVLTWQAMFGLITSPVWDQVHLWAGIVALPVLGYHVWPRAKPKVMPAARPAAVPGAGAPFVLPDFSPGRRGMWLTSGMTVIVLGAATGILAGAYELYAPDLGRYQLPADYKLPYGAEIFAPSMVRTVSGGPVDPRLLANSQSCGAAGCHKQIYREWNANTHRWASEDLAFQRVQAGLIEAEGAPAARYCAGCHDPVSLLSGYKNASNSTEAPGFKEGASCVVCHAMRRADVQGNGNYLWGPAAPYLFEYGETGRASAITHFLIRAYPRQHNTDYDLALAREPASCGACHKQFLDKAINHVGFVQLQNQYDDWEHGKWNTDPDASKRLRCQQCHMYYEHASDPSEADPYDLKAGLGSAHRNHWFAAGNQWMPDALQSPDARAQTKRVVDWLQGKKVIPEIADVWPAGPVLPIHIVPPDQIRSGEKAAFRIVITNNKAGHSFPTGPLDLIRSWVQVTVRDPSGTIVFHSGDVLPDGELEPGTFVLKGVGINAAGDEILRHDLWNYVGSRGKRTIFAGHSDMSEYTFTVPRDVLGPLTIEARLRYRKANQDFMDVVFPGQHLQSPVTDLSSDRVEVGFTTGAPTGDALPAKKPAARESTPANEPAPRP
jgi:hypothetical protein